jgi:hypothetical protein
MRRWKRKLCHDIIDLKKLYLKKYIYSLIYFLIDLFHFNQFLHIFQIKFFKNLI